MRPMPPQPHAFMRLCLIIPTHNSRRLWNSSATFRFHFHRCALDDLMLLLLLPVWMLVGRCKYMQAQTYVMLYYSYVYALCSMHTYMCIYSICNMLFCGNSRQFFSAVSINSWRYCSLIIRTQHACSLLN